jgi:hypothetical protein
MIDNPGPQRGFLLRSDRGGIVEPANDPPLWFAQIWPEIRQRVVPL